jgi:hypothetical protein
LYSIIDRNHKHATIFIFAYLYIAINPIVHSKMSLATLKRKTAAKYNTARPPQVPQSTGTLRSQGWVGSLSSALPENRYERKRILRDVGVRGRVPAVRRHRVGIYNYNDSSASRAVLAVRARNDVHLK